MKKIILLLCLFIGLTAHSQVSINSTHMPQAGDTLRYSIATLDVSVLLNYRAPGANLTWDFSGLVPREQGVRAFVNSSQTPYSNSVPSRLGLLFADTLSLGGFNILDVYNFVNSTTTDFSIDFRGASASFTQGSQPFPLSGSYSDKDEVFQFPLEYNDRDSSTFNFVFSNPFPRVYYASSGYRINDVDAWGSLTTPFGTFNCIRVVTDMVTYDTVSVSALLTGGTAQNVGLNSHTREYQWISDQVKIPVLKVNGNVFAGVFIPTTVEYRDSVRNIVPILPTIAIFRADTTVVEVGEELGFDNFSIGSTSFQWDFTPNTISYISGSSTSRNISVSFQDTGRYDVRLIASGGSNSDTLLLSDYIRVTEANVGKPEADFLADTSIVPLRTNYTIYNSSKTGINASFDWLITPRFPIAPTSLTYVEGTSNVSQDSIVVNFADTGYFDVRLIATDDGGKDTLTKKDFVYVRIPVSLEEIDTELSNKVSVHPNPVRKEGTFVIDFKQKLTVLSIEVYDLKGSVMQEQNVNQSLSRLSYSIDHASGVYFIKMTTDQGVVMKKIVVE